MSPVSSSSAGMIIGIICAVVGVCAIGGVAYYCLVHKKKMEGAAAGGDAGFNDDLYMAFIDRETA